MARYDFLNQIEETPIFQYYQKHGEKRASAAVLSKLRMEHGLAIKMANASIKVGAHIKGNKAMRAAGGHIKGGYVSIPQLLQWQNDNNFRVCDLERTEEWKNNISKAHMGKTVADETKEKLSKIVSEFNASLTKEERREKYSNDSSSRKSLKQRSEVLNMIEEDTFTTSQARMACEKYGLRNWKGLLKDKRLVKQLYKGTNQSNPSVYKKLYN